MSGKSGRQEDDSNLQSFLRTTAVAFELAWMVSCTIVMPPLLISVTLYPVCLVDLNLLAPEFFFLF